MERDPTRPPTAFDCLWCGSRHQPRAADDLEAWARLCPDCLARAGENAFLRFRLRDAIAARAAAVERRVERRDRLPEGEGPE